MSEIDWYALGRAVGGQPPWHMRRPSTDGFNAAWDAFRRGFEQRRQGVGLDDVDVEEMRVEFAILWDRSQRP